MENSDYYLLKISLAGESYVGKKAILTRFADLKFDSNNYLGAIGFDFKINNIRVDGKQVRLHAWHTAG